MTIETKNLIIGFGKAGKTLAVDLAGRGEHVILVEKSAQMYGGTCINIGCIPSKKLIHEGKSAGYSQAMVNKERLIDKLREANYKKLADHDNITVMNQTATFKNKNTVVLDNGDEITAERIFINTGASSNIPPIKGVKEYFNELIFDSTGLLSLNHYQNNAPKHLIIVGGGFIALEFAFMYHNFGSQITILEKNDVLLANQDEDIREEMLRILANKNIQVLTGVDVNGFDKNHQEVLVDFSQNGESKTLTASAVLLATGRKSTAPTLGLEHTDVKLDERGFIVTDDYLQAGEHIYAMGDVAGSPQFTFISLDDYRIITNQLFGDKSYHKKTRGVFATATFVEPPLSHIGMSQKQAVSSGKNFQVLTLKAADIVKAKVVNQTDGILKAVVDNDTHEILGVTLFCDNSHEIINLFKMAMDNHIKADYFKTQIFTHPTISEAINDLFAKLK